MTELLEEASKHHDFFKKLREQGLELDRHYIGSRYRTFTRKVQRINTRNSSEMLKLRRVDNERSREVVKRLEIYVRKIVEAFQPDLVILYGSFASGDINEGSDIDLLVVAAFNQPFLDRIKVLLSMNQESMPVEPVGYTAEEFLEMVGRRNPFVTEVIATGKILYRTDEGSKLLEKASECVGKVRYST